MDNLSAVQIATANRPLFMISFNSNSSLFRVSFNFVNTCYFFVICSFSPKKHHYKENLRDGTNLSTRTEHPVPNAVTPRRFHCRQLEYDTLKSLQLEVIMSFFAGRDVFAILPTGYGKSLCYALLQLLFDRLLSIARRLLQLLPEEKLPSRQSLLSYHWVASGIGHKHENHTHKSTKK